MERIAIIRINPGKVNKCNEDLIRLKSHSITGLELLIPTVKTYIGKVDGESTFLEKPLLLNYGFIKADIEIFTDKEKLMKIVSLSEVIMGFFYRLKEDVTRELSLYDEALSLAQTEGVNTKRLFHKSPILVRLIDEFQVTRLFKLAESMESFVGKNNLRIGSTIMLKKYPFEGMLAEVLEIRGNKVRLELQDSNLIIHQDIRDLVYLYSDYLDLDA